MTIRLVYRSDGARPQTAAFCYSKMLALVSFVRTATEVKGAAAALHGDAEPRYPSGASGDLARP
jgi:hypothetical protein